MTLLPQSLGHLLRHHGGGNGGGGGDDGDASEGNGHRGRPHLETNHARAHSLVK